MRAIFIGRECRPAIPALHTVGWDDLAGLPEGLHPEGWVIHVRGLLAGRGKWIRDTRHGGFRNAHGKSAGTGYCRHLIRAGDETSIFGDF